MLEIDDYNGDYFFEGESELEEYYSILDSLEYHSPTEEEKYYAYNIMIMDQCLSVMRELGEKTTELGAAANSAINALKKFITVYTESESCNE